MSVPQPDPASPGPAADPLGALADAYLTRLRRGETPSPTEYASRHPELAERIRELFPLLAMMERLSPGTQAELFDRDEDRARTGWQEDAPDRLGSYQILGEVGRGGMGAVYEAVQESLGRRVALKVLRTAHFNASRLERFQREARAAALLHHTNIVPVFDVGAQDGTAYYAMQLIHGSGLEQVLDELRRFRGLDSATPGRTAESRTALPSRAVSVIDVAHSLLAGDGYWRGVARIGAQVADGLEYAHQHGILHRDIKPSNLLLETSGVVWITDFGLAKLEAEGNLTQSGELVGTLRYMAPEQFEGRSDARSDVYALGMTLYELLTLRPGFRASQRYQLLQQVLHEEPPPPRRLDAAIPRDLETIVLKATARDPAARYQTAGRLASELTRFLEDRPILARRSSVVERAAKWVRRRPAIAALGLAIVLVASFGAAGVLWQWRTAVAARADLEAALGEKTAALATANEERENALQAARRARQVSTMLQELVRGGDRVGVSTFFLDLPQRSSAELTAPELLDRGVLRIHQLDSDPETQAEILETLGVIYLSLGRLDRADDLLAQSRSTRPTKPTPEIRANDLRILVGLRYFQGRYAEAEALLREVSELAPQVEPDLVTLIQALLRMEQDETDGTIRAVEQALRTATDPRSHPGPLAARRRGLILMYLSAVRARRNEHDSSLPLALEAERCLFEAKGGQSLAAFYKPVVQGMMEIELGDLGLAGRTQADRQPAVDRAMESLAKAREELGATHPVIGIMLVQLARFFEMKAATRQDAWYEPHAERLHRMALDGLLGGCGRQPRTATCMERLALLLHKRGQAREAAELLTSALGIRRDVLGPAHAETVRTAEVLRSLALP